MRRRLGTWLVGFAVLFMASGCASRLVWKSYEFSSPGLTISARQEQPEGEGSGVIVNEWAADPVEIVGAGIDGIGRTAERVVYWVKKLFTPGAGKVAAAGT